MVTKCYLTIALKPCTRKAWIICQLHLFIQQIQRSTANVMLSVNTTRKSISSVVF